ncbi:hypothetical protein ANN_21045 [Periplaneta americana]|uniref:Uncharacterized protein n=1 Tax=Periplaneta americana TaxID=6978 RepID=A0ABQ8SFG0_PERAM|nr:hypothetical protein ANN_21045 [Periplaneta americana]
MTKMEFLSSHKILCSELESNFRVYLYSASSYYERVMERRKFSPAPGFEPKFSALRADALSTKPHRIHSMMTQNICMEISYVLRYPPYLKAVSSIRNLRTCHAETLEMGMKEPRMDSANTRNELIRVSWEAIRKINKDGEAETPKFGKDNKNGFEGGGTGDIRRDAVVRSEAKLEDVELKDDRRVRTEDSLEYNYRNVNVKANSRLVCLSLSRTVAPQIIIIIIN